jgi:hypothetical protein
MKIYCFRLALIFSILFGLTLPGTVQASKGTPNSAEFGYGVQVDLEGKQVLESLASATTLRMDWIAIDFNWASHWQDKQTQPDLHLLDQVMQYAKQADISVLLSITHAPDWATTQNGPDPAVTAWFVTNLAKRYPALQSVELFPGANTRQAWGAEPNPGLYINLLKTTRGEL